LSTRIEEEGDALTLTAGDANWPAGIFMLLWLTGWTVGCVALLGAVLTQQEPFLILFAIPFWLSWIFVAACLTSVFFGRHRLVIAPEGLCYERRVLLTLAQRQVPLSEIRGFQWMDFRGDSEGSTRIGIEVRTVGRSVTFGSNLSRMEAIWLAHYLDEHLRRLHQHAKVKNLGDGDVADCRRCDNPTDGAWSLREDSADLTFQQRGRLELGKILALVFTNGFWNGIVGVFVGALLGFAPGNPPPAGIPWWGMFLFLVPFEAIGLAMFLALLLALLEPFRITRWTITPDAVEQVTTRLGLPIGWRQRYPCDTLREAAIRDDGKSSWDWSAFHGKSAQPTEEQYGLLLVNAAREEVCSIRGLTLGEARWIKGRLQERGYVR
jgi:hypothetical protein